VNIISRNIDNIKKRILNAANGNGVTLVAVTKTFSANDVEEAIKVGITDIAESKIQEALPKFDVLSNSLKGINKHFIGHLQSNKTKKAVLNFDLIQSLDSIDLANNINKYAQDINKIQECLIELKVSQEESKFGVPIEKIYGIYDHCLANCKNILISGIMTIAPYFDDKENVRPYFQKAYNIYSDMQKKVGNEKFKILSMGMSNDFEIAIEEGSNMVRVGSAIFGERNYDK
jgi:hypothetical protein